jgi:hypothetical protein
MALLLNQLFFVIQLTTHQAQISLTNSSSNYFRCVTYFSHHSTFIINHFYKTRDMLGDMSDKLSLFLLVNKRKNLYNFFVTFNIISAYSVQPNRREHTRFVLKIVVFLKQNKKIVD